jgi:hypothetical protein
MAACVNDGFGRLGEESGEEAKKKSRNGVQGEGGTSGDPGRQDPSEFAEQFDVQPHQITEWEKQLLERAGEVFGGPSRRWT